MIFTEKQLLQHAYFFFKYTWNGMSYAILPLIIYIKMEQLGHMSSIDLDYGNNQINNFNLI